MSHHPSFEQLEAFLRGELPLVEFAPLLAHLARECGACLDRLVQLAEASLQEEDAQLFAGLDAACSRAFERASTVTARAGRRIDRKRSQVARALAAAGEEREVEDLLLADRGLGGWALTDVLIERSHELRHRDPRRMLRLARLAQITADILSPGRHGRGLASDLQARAWAELANAYRVTGDLPEARKAMTVAVRRCGEGTGDSLLLARVVNLAAVLRGDERRLSEALGLFDQAYRLYVATGERHLAGRVLISKGIQAGNGGDPEAGLRLLRQGLAVVEAERDPKLVLNAVHGMADFLVMLGRFREARNLIWRGGLRRLTADRITRLRLRWVEAKIDGGLGQLVRSEAALCEVRETLGREGLFYDQALASLDLAAVRLRLGKAAEVEPMVEEMVAVFSVLGVRREALAALRLLT